ELMEEIVRTHFDELDDHLLKEAMDAFYMIRGLKLIRKKPSTSELIDWLRALMIGGIDPDRIAAEVPFAGVLLKKDEDLEELKKLQ
ncbi:MAG: MoxR family ATPase, partial [Lachnospiraceae bacterium]|nr:MoxR family ATPase [Lachnospiraceae bacterium]